MGQRLASLWRRQNPNVPGHANAEDIINLIFGSFASDCLGARDDQIKEQLRKATRNFTAHDYFGFDPAIEPPTPNLPIECCCGTLDERGQKRCTKCKRRLKMMGRYTVWRDALIRTYTSERYGVSLGASYIDALKWLPVMRPYPRPGNGDKSDFYDAVYAVTHVAYTLNGYSCYQLSPRWLPFEYAFLKQNLSQAIEMNDPDIMGEFLDSLKSLGLNENHPLIRKGVSYLLRSQNQDGSWGEIAVDDIYQRYHPTWTAIDGLRDYAWRGTRLCFPKVAPLLKGKVNNDEATQRN